MDHVVSRVADLQLGDEALWRALMRAILDRWSAQQDVWFAQQDVPEAERIPIRGDTRLTLTREALSGLADQLPPDLHERLTMAMVLIFGAEAMITAHDVTALSPAEAKTTMRWAARALIQAALAEAASDSAHHSTAPP